jgi:hypothetical protein
MTGVDEDDKTPPADTPGADETASGTAEEPIAPGEAQPGDHVERAQNLGGPVDVSPLRPPRPPR